MSKEARAAKIAEIADRLSVPPRWLDALINFETAGTYSTTIKNPYSSARGLIQFTDAAAQDLGFSDSKALVNTYPEFDRQMEFAVYPYLKRYMPFANRQQLYMAVFFPRYRNRAPSTEFPDTVKNVNPGIDTIQDYMDFVDKRIKGETLHAFPKALAVPLIVAAGAAAFWFLTRSS